MAGKTKTTTGYSKAALANINPATSAVQAGYDQSSALANRATGILSNNFDSVVGQTLNNPGLAAANSFNTDVLGGKYLDANPYLDQLVSDTNASVANKVNGSIGSRGLAGGSAHTQLLASELARNETGLRANQYNTERGYQQQAIGNAAGLSSAGNQGIAALLAYLSGTAEMPQAVAGQYASGIQNLWGNNTNTTQKQGLGSLLAGVAGAGLATYASGGFR